MTIHQLKEPCWLLDPNPWGEDAGTPHYATWAKAAADLSEFRAEQVDQNPDDPGDLESIQVKALPCSCWVAECDAPDGPEGICAQTLGDEDEGPSCIHFATLEELPGWMPGEKWARSGPDGALCYVHGPYRDGGEPEPAQDPAELEAARQLVIPGVLP